MKPAPSNVISLTGDQLTREQLRKVRENLGFRQDAPHQRALEAGLRLIEIAAEIREMGRGLEHEVCVFPVQQQLRDARLKLLQEEAKVLIPLANLYDKLRKAYLPDLAERHVEPGEKGDVDALPDSDALVTAMRAARTAIYGAGSA